MHGLKSALICEDGFAIDRMTLDESTAHYVIHHHSEAER
jgi:hypothetical protein